MDHLFNVQIDVRLPLYIGLLLLIASTAGAAHAYGAAGPTDEESLEERVQRGASSILAEQFPEYASRLRVRVIRVGGPTPVDEPVHLRFPATEGVPKGHMQVRLTMHAAAGTTDAGWALLYVAHFDSVAVASRDIPKGDPVEADDLGIAWIDVTTFRGSPLALKAVNDLRSGHAFFATHPISAGDALRDGDLRPPFAADTGDRVTLTYRRQQITLTLPCRAREPGVVGDVVRVYSDAARTTYKARLTGSGTAEWVATL